MSSMLRIAVVAGLVVIAASSDAVAQGFCGCMSLQQSQPLNQIIHDSKYYFQAKRIKTTTTQKGDNKKNLTEFEVTEIFRAPQNSLKTGERFNLSVTPDLSFDSKTEEIVEAPQQPESSVLVVSDGADFPAEAQIVCETNPAIKAYIASTSKALESVKEESERRRIFVQYLGNEESVIADDAIMEIFAGGYEGIAALRTELPREQLLAAFENPRNSSMLTFYGVLIGMCGNPDDAAVLERKFVEVNGDFRNGIEGVIVGYLLIRGEDGLKVVEDSKMRARTAKTAAGEEIQLPFSETYAALQALRDLWNFEPRRIPAERLRESMRILLQRREMADLVINELAKWKDWTAQDRIVAMFDEEEFQIPATQRAIARFLYYSSHETGEVASDGKTVRPEHAVRAEETLKSLKEKNPKLVDDALRFLVR